MERTTEFCPFEPRVYLKAEGACLRQFLFVDLTESPRKREFQLREIAMFVEIVLINDLWGSTRPTVSGTTLAGGPGLCKTAR